MSEADQPQWTANGIRLRTGSAEFGELETFADLGHDPQRTRTQLAAEGYLLLRAFFPIEAVERARHAALHALHSGGLLDSKRPAAEAWPAPRVRDKRVLPDLGQLPEVQDLVRAPRLIAFFAGLLGGAPRVLDQVLLRMIPPGHSTTPHCDIVYMGRGTSRLFTAWIPLGNVPRSSGALMILERSHLLDQLRNRYWEHDADRERILDRLRIRHGHRVLQLESEPADERWVGQDSRGHAGHG
jgi:hypothetical protein